MLDACCHIFHFLTDSFNTGVVLDVILDFNALDLCFEGHSLVTDEVCRVTIKALVKGDVT